MKATSKNKEKRLLQLLGVMVSCQLLIGCNYSTTNDEQTFVVYYEDGPFFYDWLTVTDKDDIKDLSEKRLHGLHLDLLEYPYTVESVVIYSRDYFFFKRKNAGFSVIKIIIPEELRKCLSQKGLDKCAALTQSNWLKKWVSDVDTLYATIIDSTNFFVAEKSDLGLRHLIALGNRPEALYLFSFYSPPDDFNKEYKETFQSILSKVSFNPIQIQKAYKDNVAGFFTGILHGVGWLPRWVNSWFEYRDVWAEHNTGFGYIVGFVIGFIIGLAIGFEEASKS